MAFSLNVEKTSPLNVAYILKVFKSHTLSSYPGMFKSAYFKGLLGKKKNQLCSGSGLAHFELTSPAFPSL